MGMLGTAGSLCANLGEEENKIPTTAGENPTQKKNKH